MKRKKKKTKLVDQFHNDGCLRDICLFGRLNLFILKTMASNFSANQFDKEFNSRSLCNWEVPHWYPKHPRRRTTTTKFIANDSGHLLPNVERPKSSPWGRFQTTWQLPPAITRAQANEINAPPIGSSRWALPDPNKKVTKKTDEGKVVKIKEETPEVAKTIEIKAEEELTAELVKKTSPKRVFNEKEKLNSPLAISEQGRRAIRHETLERDNDEH